MQLQLWGLRNSANSDVSSKKKWTPSFRIAIRFFLFYSSTIMSWWQKSLGSEFKEQPLRFEAFSITMVHSNTVGNCWSSDSGIWLRGAKHDQLRRPRSIRQRLSAKPSARLIRLTFICQSRHRALHAMQRALMMGASSTASLPLIHVQSAPQKRNKGAEAKAHGWCVQQAPHYGASELNVLWFDLIHHVKRCGWREKLQSCSFAREENALFFFWGS